MFELRNWTRTRCGNSDSCGSGGILMTATYYAWFPFKSEGKCTLVASSNHPHYIPSARGAQNIMCTNANFNLVEHKL